MHYFKHTFQKRSIQILFSNFTFSSGFSVHLIADEEDVITYDQENDRETLMLTDQIRVAALDYAYIQNNISVVVWTDTATHTGKMTMNNFLV